ncbi:hypothetical protein EYV94_19970 [Puteibacter caeruleilacunae]|nr:hypothetical protein EYV94_19970 [Puteibacter caeruleilacunae]
MHFRRLKIDTLLLFQVGPVWLLLNLVIAFVNSSLLSLVLVALRDSWLFCLLALLIVRKEWKYLTFFYLSMLLGLLPALWLTSSFNLSIYLYGLRDIGLILFILGIASNKIEATPKIIHITALFIILGSLFQIITQQFLGDEIFQTFSNANNYFANKGISSNLKGGLFGDRLYYPLYSSSLIGTFLSLYLFVKKGIIKKIFLLIISFLTLSKAVFVLIFFYFFKGQRRSQIVLLMTLVVFLLPPILNGILQALPTSIITFHITSILDRFNAFNYLGDMLLNLPDYLGYNSVAGFVISGRDASLAPESLIISRLLDYKQFSLVIIVALFSILLKMEKHQLNIVTPIFFLFLFSSLSNHPIAFLPLILFDERIKS